MSSGIRNVLTQKVSEIAQSLRGSDLKNLTKISSRLTIKCCPDSGEFCIALPLKTKEYDIKSIAENITKCSHDAFPGTCVNSDGRVVDFKISRNSLVSNILESNIQGVTAPFIDIKQQSIVVEFSSPNIAKPFHVGHLRSTIIGNYIANLHSFLSNNVQRINYLGDWGTQFGYIQVGIDLLGITDDAIKNDPIGELYRAYVHANQLSENDATIAKKARQIFENLEKGADFASSQRWKVFRKYTTNELEKMYKRLGVTFDEYHWESMYKSQEIGKIIELMEALCLLKIDKEERRVVVLNENRNIPIIKSDGSTLYVTRDIAAAIDRFERYNFDQMYYVVDNAQTDHFKNLFTILERMQQPFASRLHHVKFGKIRGMCTRKGTAVFLEDFLNEARDAMRKKQTQSSTTKVSLDLNDSSSDNLGMAAVIIHDLKQKRTRDYEFNWNIALDIKGETGVKLQYTHCRLINLEENCGVTLPLECDPSLLDEPIVNALVGKIIQFDEAILSSHETLEPCNLAKYLFDLSHIVNKALMELRVKDEPTDVAAQRLLLFRVARNVLAQGMKILGMTPLNKM